MDFNTLAALHEPESFRNRPTGEPVRRPARRPRRRRGATFAAALRRAVALRPRRPRRTAPVSAAHPTRTRATV